MSGGSITMKKSGKANKILFYIERTAFLLFLLYCNASNTEKIKLLNFRTRLQEKNFARNKTKQVAWFVSNCGARYLQGVC